MRHYTRCAAIRLAEILICTFALGQSANHWDLPVTPYVQADLRIPICVIPVEEANWQIHLQHELVFDGQNYFSRFIIPEVESYLVAGDPGVFLWRPPGGKERKLYLDQRESQVAWLIRELGPNRYEICSKDGANVYVYEKCRLRSVISRNEKFIFDWEDAGNLLVNSIDGEGAVPLLTVRFNRNGLVTTVETAERKLFGTYNGDMELVKWEAVGVESPLAIFDYEQRLLSEASFMGVAAQFKWGIPIFAERFKPPVNMRPVVIADGTRRYSTIISRDWIRTRAADAASGHAIFWEVDLRTGAVSIFR